MHIITKINAVQPGLASLLVPDPLQGCWNNTWNNNEVLNRLTRVSVQVQIHGCNVCLWQALCTIWLQNTLADWWPVIPQHCSSSYGSSCCNYCADCFFFFFVPCAMVSVKQGLQQCSVSAQMPVSSLVCCNHAEKWQALVLAPFSSCDSTVSLSCGEFVQAFSSVTWDLVRTSVLCSKKIKIKIHATAVATNSESCSGVVRQMVQVQKFFLPLNFICS